MAELDLEDDEFWSAMLDVESWMRGRWLRGQFNWSNGNIESRSLAKMTGSVGKRSLQVIFSVGGVGGVAWEESTKGRGAGQVNKLAGELGGEGAWRERWQHRYRSMIDMKEVP